jgi:uncharacterized protein YbjQ (UPF0145 family)
MSAERMLDDLPKVDHAMTSTTFDLPGYRITQCLGVVRGITVRSPSFGKQITGSFRQLAGGEIKQFLEVAENTREVAFQRMLQHAAMRGANAVLGVRYDANELGQGTSEVIAYGTAAVAIPTDR